MCPGIFGYRGTLLYIPCDVISITCELGVVFRVNEISRSKPLHCSIRGCGCFFGDWTKGLSYVRSRGTTARGGLVFRHADGRGPGGRAPGLSDRAVPGMPAGKGSRVCRPYGEIHHPAGDGDQAIEPVPGSMRRKRAAELLGAGVGAVHDRVKAYRGGGVAALRPENRNSGQSKTPT